MTSTHPKTTIAYALAAGPDESEPHAQEVDVLATPKHYDLHKVLIPAVKSIYESLRADSPGRASVDRLLEHCLAELGTRTVKPIEPPTPRTSESGPTSVGGVMSVKLTPVLTAVPTLPAASTARTEYVSPTPSGAVLSVYVVPVTVVSDVPLRLTL